ncbi:MAG: hypothetical protein IT494_06020 [Gammaproteobacteria bacterium]|nr:hypothetical protein [Gammaproteobacteria bacterium]
MRYALLGIAVLIVVVIGAGFLPEDPGFVVLSYGTKLVRMSFVLFVLLLLACGMVVFLLLWLLGRLISLRARIAGWRRQRRRAKAREALERGYRALAEGDWAHADKLFQQGIQADAGEPLLYLGAARAAEARQDPIGRDTWLTQARETLPDAELAIGLRQAEIALAAAAAPQARAILDRLRHLAPKNAEVLRLLRATCVATGAWQELLDDVIPTSRRVQAVAELDQLERRAVTALLADATTVDRVESIWERMPRALRREPEVLGAYAAALLHAGAGGRAEAILRKQLQRNPDAALIPTYCMLPGDDPGKQQRFLEELARSRPDDPALLLALGRLDLARSLWGSARDRLQRLLAQQPSAEAYQLLAQAHEGMKQPTEAAACYRKGLQLAATRGV